MELMESVEDIPLGAMDQGIKWEWETFPQYLNYLSTLQFAIDIGAMIGHGPVRAFVMGKRANLSDRPGGPKNAPVQPAEIGAL
jgi:N-acyl-D-amino-acid deacylase